MKRTLIRAGLNLSESALVRLNLARLNADEAQELRETLLSPSLDWDELGQLVAMNQVAPLALRHLGELGLVSKVPDPILEGWEPEVEKIRTQSETRAQTGRRILQALAAAGIRTVVLSGSALAEQIYGLRSYRQMSDLDLFIRFEDAKEAEKILANQGFTCRGEIPGVREVSERTHLSAPFYSDDGSTIVELQWGLHSPHSRWRADLGGIWRRVVPTEVFEGPAFRLSWEDQLLHLCLRLRFFQTGLRELADLINLCLFAQPSIDWNVIEARANAWEVEAPTYRALALADRLVDLGLPSGLLERLAARTDRMSLRDTAARSDSPSFLLRSRSDQSRRIEECFLELRMSEDLKQSLQILSKLWSLTLWPEEGELSKLVPDGRAARVRAPLRLWSALARDHGYWTISKLGLSQWSELLRTARKVKSPAR